MLLSPNNQLRCAGASADQGLHQPSSSAPQAWHHHPRNRSRCKSLLAGAFKCHQRGSTTPSHPLSTPATQSHSHKASSATDEIRTKAPQLSAFAAAVLLSWSSVAPPYSSASPAIQEQASSAQPAANATASSLIDPAFKTVSSPGLVDTPPSAAEGSATGERSASRATQVLSSDALATYRLGRDSTERRHLDYHGATAQARLELVLKNLHDGMRFICWIDCQLYAVFVRYGTVLQPICHLTRSGVNIVLPQHRVPFLYLRLSPRP